MERTLPGGLLVWTGFAGCTSCGLVVARLTLALNPQIHELGRDTAVLWAWFFLAYGLVGLALGAFAAATAAALRRLPLAPSVQMRVTGGLVSVVGLGPLVYSALLPDVGLHATLLTRLFSSGRPLSRLGLAGGGLAALIVGGMVLGRGGRALAERLRVTPLRLAVGVWAGAISILTLEALVARPEPATRVPPPAANVVQGPPPAAPVLLLCIDGADPDDVVLPLLAAGDLPTFARLKGEGVWGELETLEPALSPVIWTTLATGKPPAEHGVHQFIVFQLPGMERPVLQFPLHAGLNFKLFPWLERLPGVPQLQAPYTSNMWRAEALWHIAGLARRVGVYRWRGTWPAEEVNGFNVATGVALLDSLHAFGDRGGPASSSEGLTAPRELYLRLGGKAKKPGLEEVRDYIGDGFEIEPDDPRVARVLRSLEDGTVRHLLSLIEEFQPHFVAASFFSVDGFQHHFGTVRGGDRPFGPAVEERYRWTDARLQELLDGLPGPVNLIVVSDHGFDFAGGHHTHGPPGVFLAAGPAFRSGETIEGLSVYDIAPLVLHLLGMPLAADMPGTERAKYRQVLTPEFLDRVQVPTLATYDGSRRASYRPAPSPDVERTLEELRALGYLE